MEGRLTTGISRPLPRKRRTSFSKNHSNKIKGNLSGSDSDVFFWGKSGDVFGHFSGGSVIYDDDTLPLLLLHHQFPFFSQISASISNQRFWLKLSADSDRTFEPFSMCSHKTKVQP